MICVYMGEKEIFHWELSFKIKLKMFLKIYVKYISVYNNINKSNIHIIYYQNKLITSSEIL